MKTNVVERKITKSADFQESTFSIKASAKAFQILSDGLYSDKILAIIRELSCNAYDSHVEAKNTDTPFDLHLPTSLEPTFTIRDYGTGLCKSDIETVYTTYFESTKTNSNDAIGCLGLGSKSPFSYVEMFTVMSFFNGKKYVYNAMLNSQGFPSIMFIGESKTDEPNGVQVQFAVRNNDIWDFSEKAKRALKHFPVKPNLTGQNINFESTDYTVKTETWGLVKHDGYRGGHASAVMGNIAYPISFHKVDLTSQENTVIRNFNIDFFFNIGDLNVAANRESLSYTDDTIQVIRDRIQEIIEHEESRMQKELDLHTTYWDAVCWYWKEIASNEIVSMLLRSKHLKWKGKTLSETSSIDYTEYNGKEDPKNENLFRVLHSHRESKWSRKKGSYGYVSRPQFTSNIQVRETTTIFLQDAKKRVNARVKVYMENNPNIKNVYLVTNYEDEHLRTLKKKLGIKKFRKLSEIEPPVIIRKKKGEKSWSADGNIVVKSTSTSMRYADADYWATIPVDNTEEYNMEEGGFYLPINRWKFINNKGSEVSMDSMQSMLNVYTYLTGEPIPRIYGVKRVAMKKVEGEKEWVNWLTHMDKKILEKCKGKKIIDSLKALRCDGMSFGNHKRLLDQATYFDKRDEEKKQIKGRNAMEELLKSPIYSQLNDHLQGRIRLEKDKDVIVSLYNYIHKSNGSLLTEVDKAIEPLQDLNRTMNARYPLLVHTWISDLTRGYAGIFNVIDYINGRDMLEEERELKRLEEEELKELEAELEKLEAEETEETKQTEKVGE